MLVLGEVLYDPIHQGPLPEGIGIRLLLALAALMRSLGAVIAMYTASSLLWSQLLYQSILIGGMPRELGNMVLPSLPEAGIFLLCTWALLRFGHQLTLRSVGLTLQRSQLIEYGIFTLLGMASVAATVLPLAATAQGRFVPATPQLQNPFSWIVFIFLLALAAFSEELLVHGYAFQTLIPPFHLLGALVFMNGFFASLHLLNKGANEFTVSNTFLAGCVLGMLLVLRRSLWAAAAAHFGWNLGTGLLGVNLSGFHLQLVPYRFVWSGEGFWSGEDYGPEGGLPATILLCLLLLLQVHLYYRDREIAATPGPGEIL